MKNTGDRTETTVESQYPNKKRDGGVNHFFWAAFHLLQAASRTTQACFRSRTEAQSSLRVLHGTKLKWLFVALEQIASGIYSSSQLPITGGTEEASIVLTHNAIMIKAIKWRRRAPVLHRQQASSPVTSESFKKSLCWVCICSTHSKFTIYSY